jgi:hypothetical protein
MGLPLVVETGDSIRDGAGKSVSIGEGAISELMLLEVAPASFDVVQLRGVFRQPFEGEPGARGERLCGQLASVDRPVIENRDQGPGSFGGAICGAELIEQGNEVGRAFGTPRTAAISSAFRPSSVNRIARARSASPRCSDFDRSRNTACSAALAVSVDFPGIPGLHSPHPRQTIQSIAHSHAGCLDRNSAGIPQLPKIEIWRAKAHALPTELRPIIETVALSGSEGPFG